MKYELRILADTPQELAAILNGSTGLTRADTGAFDASLPQRIAAVSASINPANAPDDETGPVNHGSVDSQGIPWDERIHSGNRAVNADGSWRKRRGVDDATYNAVTAELRARPTNVGAASPVAPASPALAAAPAALNPAPMAPQPMPAAMPAPAPVAAVPPMPANPEPQPMPAAMPAPAQAAPAAPTVQATGAGDPYYDFATFMQQLPPLMASGKMDAPYLAQLAQRLGINAVTDLSQPANKDKIATAWATILAEKVNV